ncbi:hypothetical protein [Candidatus Hodarchaeum mangrovi]
MVLIYERVLFSGYASPYGKVGSVPLALEFALIFCSLEFIYSQCLNLADFYFASHLILKTRIPIFDASV